MMTLSKDEARQYIKGQLLDFLSAEFGIKIKGNEKIHCLNPAHADNDASMSYDKRRNKLHCFSCGADYDTLDLIGIAHNLTDPAETFKKAYEIYGIETDSAYRKESAPQKAKPVNAPDPATQDYISQCHERVNQTDYFIRRGLTLEIIDRFKLGYDPTFSTFENDEQGKFKGMTNWQAVIIPNGGTFNARNTDPNADKHNRYRKPKGKSAEIFNISALDKKGIVYVAEGELDAISIITAGAQAVGLASASGVNDLLKHLESYKPKAHLVLVPDNDERGEEARAKLEEGLQRLSIPYSVDRLSGEHKDCNEALVKDRDFFLQAIKDSLRDIQAEISLEEEAEKRKNRFVPMGGLKIKKPEYLVAGIVEKNALTVIFGATYTGKSFFALDMLLTVAKGIPFHGRKVEQAPCFYICNEGESSIGVRRGAWEKGRGETIDEKTPIYICNRPFTLPDPETERQLIADIDGIIDEYKISTPGVFCIDTLSKNYGADENDNSAMTAYLQTMDRLKYRYPGSTIILIHHSGHNAQERARGASALKAGIDCEMLVKGDEETYTVTCSKMKNAPQFKDMTFKKEVIELLDDDGEPVTSICPIEIQGATDSRSSTGNKISPTNQENLKTFHEALRESIRRKVEADNLSDIHRGLTVEEWREVFYRRSTADSSEAKRKAFQRARKDLVSYGLLEVDSDIYKLAGETHTQTASANFLAIKAELAGQRDRTGQQRDIVPTYSGTGQDTPPLGVSLSRLSRVEKNNSDPLPIGNDFQQAQEWADSQPELKQDLMKRADQSEADPIMPLPAETIYKGLVLNEYRKAETPPAEYDEATAQRWLETAPEKVQEAYRQRVKLYSQSPSMAKSGQALRKTWEAFHRREVA